MPRMLDTNTHRAIDAEWVGTPLALSAGHAEVSLTTHTRMAADARGLVHGGFVFGLADYAAMLAGIFILGKFIDFFAATYEVGDTTPRGITLAAYTATPMFLIGVIAVYPNIWVNMLAGLVAITYAVYLLYEGLPILMKIPEDRGFMFATSVLTVGLVMFVSLLAMTVVIWSLGVGPAYVL